MARGKKTSPDLHECLQSLKNISRNLPKSPPRHIAEIYLAAVGLLCHLKVDQSTLQATAQENKEATCPLPNKTPAITAVLQDPRLFQALLNCLRVNTAAGSESHSDLGGSLGTTNRIHASSIHLQHPNHGNLIGRKRTNSVSSELDSHVSKAMKLSHSPVPTAVKLFHRNQADKNTGNVHSPTLNVQVVAATILYMAFSHIDHWPVQLIRAYADDCFGPRLWVDDERCRILVDNLKLAHIPTDDNNDVPMEDDSVLDDAAKVAESFDKIDEIPQGGDTASDHAANSEQRRRGSLSSHGSSAQTVGHAHSASTSSLPRTSSQDDADSVKKAKTGRKAKRKSTVKSAAADGIDGDGSSSSSGEEDEEVIVTTKSAGDSSSPKKAGSDGEKALSPTNSQADSETGANVSNKNLLLYRLYPLKQSRLDLTRVRQRYFGVNLENAWREISISLTGRLDSKAKQNSSLLQSLHSFTSIPGVRDLIAGNLEKWLQSPGLSGLARTLFASTVNHMKNVDPPLPADEEAIRKLLSMRLKANQLSVHIENVTAIAAKIPTGAIAQQIYHQLLWEMLHTIGRGADASVCDHLKMVGAVYSALPRNISADGIAASLLMIIGDAVSHISSDQSRVRRKQLVKNLEHILQLVAQQLGSSFDSCKLLGSLMTFNIRDESWTIEDEEDRARLMFQCVMLLVPPSPKEFARNPVKSARKYSLAAEPDTDSLKRNLTAARKLLLSWFCTDYGPRFQNLVQEKNIEEDEIGAGPPTFHSVLGGGHGDVRRRPKWLNTARCMLFMESGNSSYMQRFMRSDHLVDDNNPNWPGEKYRIDQCHEYGCDFDDEMMWIILRSASLEDEGVSAEMALTLLEHLFECCSLSQCGSLKISDMMLAWELYTLVLYEPPETKLAECETSGSQFEDAEEEGGDGVDGRRINTGDLDLPQLALPGRWWRATIIALVMCGVAPEKIGATVWEEHPTLRAMIKMVTSGRYRFPTVDCDDMGRNEMKKDEQIMREEEARIAERLFIPPKSQPKCVSENNELNYGRVRVSARQQQKRERALKKQREKEAAEAVLEESKRKKKLRAAQKTIMLWDPTNPARKPPREVAELLVTVEAHFGLSKTFQRNIEPDFLLMTIGKTTRGAIERAYDWLIPVISTMPDIIARLHASASCVLLLRAYGTEGDERAQLKELSLPLLRHVSDSLTGCFGQSDAVRAFDLLMADVASHNPDRRRCARRVLYDSIGKLKASGEGEGSPKISSWMLNILRLEHSKFLVGDAINHMSTAVTFERGVVLRNLLVALNELISFAKKNRIEGDWDFADIFIRLISSRPSVCAETMDRFVDLRTLGIRTVYQEFQSGVEDSSDLGTSSNNVAVALYGSSLSETATLPLVLLQAASVLLSIWKEGNGAASKGGSRDESVRLDEKEPASAISNLADMLLHPMNNQGSILRNGEDARGLASAKIIGTEKSALTVESWVMLAKARSDSIARRAALTAPNGFLPRLLLCSGLPKASLLTMIDRLGKMGEKSAAQDTIFNELLVPSAASEWDIGRLGQRKEVARKLLGRLTAYLRMNKVPTETGKIEISTSFLDWLSQECAVGARPRKPKSKQKLKANIVGLRTLANASSFLQTLQDGSTLSAKDYLEDDAEVDMFRPGMENKRIVNESNDISTEEDIQKSIQENRPDQLEDLLKQQVRALDATTEYSRLKRLATLVLRTYISARQHHDSLSRVILSWVPSLSRSSGSPELWEVIFSNQAGLVNEKLDLLLCRCIATWCPLHVEDCCDWVLCEGKEIEKSKSNLPRLTRYLILTSGQNSIQLDAFASEACLGELASWGKSDDFIGACANIAFAGMKMASSLDKHSQHSELCSRNDLPGWLLLVLLLAKCGRAQMKYVCEGVLQRISHPIEGLSCSFLRAVFLRLYVSNPFGMNLGIAMVRAVLMEAAEEYSATWLDWRSPLDGQFQDMLESVMSGSGQRLVRPLADLSKKHPLLVLRTSPVIVKFLEKDARVVQRSPKELRGVIHGQSLTGPLNAVLAGRTVKVNVQHWGFTYTEHIWIALLDIICAVPGPVLFSCGLKMGLLDFLNVCLRLMFVQSQLKRNDRESRVRDKLKDVFSAFRKSNKPGWERWMASPFPELPSLGETKNVMICCDFLDSKATVEQVQDP